MKKETKTEAKPEPDHKPITLPGGIEVYVATEAACHDVIKQTLAADKLAPNGFLPEHIRKVLQDAITKTD